MKIDAQGLYYRDLNTKIRAAVAAGADKIELDNVNVRLVELEQWRAESE